MSCFAKISSSTWRSKITVLSQESSEGDEYTSRENLTSYDEPRTKAIGVDLYIQLKMITFFMKDRKTDPANRLQRHEY